MTNPVTATTTPDAPQAGDTRPERIVEWPPADAFGARRGDQREHGYHDPDSPSHGRLSAAMVTQLTRLAQTIATPEALITTEPPTEGKPYTSTGLSSLQPQIDVMHAIFGPPHWRLRERELEDGVLDLELVIGNDLDAPPGSTRPPAKHTRRRRRCCCATGCAARTRAGAATATATRARSPTAPSDCWP